MFIIFIFNFLEDDYVGKTKYVKIAPKPMFQALQNIGLYKY